MYYIYAIADFIISNWIWHFTWGWAHIVCNVFILWFLLATIVSLSWLRSALLSLMAHITVSLMFSGIASIIIKGCEVPIQMDNYMIVYDHTYYVTGSFAALYGLLLAIFFTVFSYAYPLPLLRMYLAIILSGCISAICATWYINF
ncbi:MAG TPA: hypothetical protein VGW78_04525 [Candidatus Babeliales bacterium]|jgi:hypothetical protein|nr:hypothetical protein [Candidatus Babeliales bacterium]